MRVLVVDDDHGSRLVAEATVAALGHECTTAADGAQAWQIIEQQPPDVVISDRAMPGLNGLELCRQIRASDSPGYIYIILLTSLTQQQDVIAGMTAGADDYITKPLEPFELQTRLLAAERVTSLHAELGRARTELTRVANTDPLTGLRNRLGLAADLDHLHRVSQRYDRPYTLALCDLDHFKGYNDTYGHPAGDQVLRRLAQVLRGALRDVDLIYRYGGEEFLILLPEQTSAGAVTAMQRAVDNLAQLRIEHRMAEPDKIVTLSVGVASYGPPSQLTAEKLLQGADAALYQAKAAGRNRVVATTCDQSQSSRAVPE